MTTASPSSLGSLAVTAALLAIGLSSLDGSRDLGSRLRDDGKNRVDWDRMEAAYYERLLASGSAEPRQVPAPPPFKDGPLAIPVSDYRECVLKPGLRTCTRHGTWTTNELGLRDRPCSSSKRAGVFRVVLLGDSIGVGWGVDDGQGFEPRLEAALNARSRSLGGPEIEVLNLCVPGYAPGQRVEHLRRLGASLAPDLILYEATAADLAWDERRLRMLLPLGVGDDLPMFADVLERAEWSRGLSPNDSKRALARLRSLRPVLLESAYRELAAVAEELGCPVGWALLPRVGRASDPDERQLIVDRARRCGFAAVLDLSETFDGIAPETLAVAPDDYHPNAEGHTLLARRLERGLMDVATRDWPWSRLNPAVAAAGGGPSR